MTASSDPVEYRNNSESVPHPESDITERIPAFERQQTELAVKENRSTCSEIGPYEQSTACIKSGLNELDTNMSGKHGFESGTECQPSYVSVDGSAGTVEFQPSMASVIESQSNLPSESESLSPENNLDNLPRQDTMIVADTESYNSEYPASTASGTQRMSRNQRSNFRNKS